MPMIKVSMTSGRSSEQKLAFIKKVTRLANEVLGAPMNSISVIIDDHYSLEDWAVGGLTWSEREKHKISLVDISQEGTR